MVILYNYFLHLIYPHHDVYLINYHSYSSLKSLSYSYNSYQIILLRCLKVLGGDSSQGTQCTIRLIQQAHVFVFRLGWSLTHLCLSCPQVFPPEFGLRRVLLLVLKGRVF